MEIIKSYTDLSQSKTLSKILSHESADNVIVSFGSREGTKTVTMPKEPLDAIKTPFADIRETTMCWSLAALLGVLPEEIKYYAPNLQKEDGKYSIAYGDDELLCIADNPVDACYEMILKLYELNLL